MTKYVKVNGNIRDSVNSESDSVEDDLLIGIHLCNNESVPGSTLYTGFHTKKGSSSGDPDGICLGILITKPSELTSIARLRVLICNQINPLPVAFKFRTKQGWPVLRNQEADISARMVISLRNTVVIERCFVKPRIGVQLLNGQSLGFVFVDLKSNLQCLRLEISAQIHGFQNFQFVDGNSWPITEEQESQLTVLDILTNSHITVQHQISLESMLKYCPEESSTYMLDVPLRKKKKALKMSNQLTFQNSKDEARRVCDIDHMDGSTPVASKQILISYVRAEAAQHALRLKAELTKFDYSVFLDVHEIKFGVDWQDSLNDAVSNCEVFLPLITPRYGETQWTNREVKLADVLGKLIIPVSFLNTWPPKCLAIQFASTQFISWKPKDIIDIELKNGEPPEMVYNINKWDEIYVERAATDIGKLIETYMNKQGDNVDGPGMKKPTLTSLKSYPSKLPNLNLDLSLVNAPREGKPLIVICVHPEQMSFGNYLKGLLISEGYEAWCSFEIGYGLTESGSAASLNSDVADICNVEGKLSDSVSQFAGCYSPRSMEKRIQFQGKADEAGVVIFVLSKAFSQSKMCQQQVYYCEHRKRFIPLKFEDFAMPYWMSMLIGTSTFLFLQYPFMKDSQRECFEKSIVTQVNSCLFPQSGNPSPTEMRDKQLSEAVSSLTKSLPKHGNVYIAGGTHFYHKDSRDICMSIGKHLAHNHEVTVVTGGFFGIGETVALSFQEERKANHRKSGVVHVLPFQDKDDHSSRGRQRADKTFQPPPFGKSVFVGNSIRDRESIVARAIDICILIEGGPGAAHEAEEFAWNDHIVIPVQITGGAAGGKFNVPQKIFEVPQSVLPADWSVLSNTSAQPEDIGTAVGNVVRSLITSRPANSPPPIKVIPAKSPLTPPQSVSRPTTPPPPPNARKRKRSIATLRIMVDSDDKQS